MAFEKAPAALVAAFESAIGSIDGIAAKKMFGFPCAFVNGWMVAGIFESSLFVRLDPDGDAEARSVGAGDFAPMPGRPMRGYVVLPPRIVSSDAALSAWIARAATFASTLPPKEKASAKGGAKKAGAKGGAKKAAPKKAERPAPKKAEKPASKKAEKPASKAPPKKRANVG